MKILPGDLLHSLKINWSNGFEVVRSNSLNEVTTHRIENLPDGGERRTNLFPDGTQTSMLIGTDGGSSTNLPDGTSMSVLEGPDPRFGMQASLAKNQSLSTPGGLTSNTTLVDRPPWPTPMTP